MNSKLEIIKTSYEYIQILIKGIDEKIVNNKSGNEKNICISIPEISVGIGHIIEVITLTENVGGRVVTLEKLQISLEEIVEGLESEDYLLVNDIFNYDIIPMLESIQEHMKNFIIDKE